MKCYICLKQLGAEFQSNIIRKCSQFLQQGGSSISKNWTEQGNEAKDEVSIVNLLAYCMSQNDNLVALFNTIQNIQLRFSQELCPLGSPVAELYTIYNIVNNLFQVGKK